MRKVEPLSRALSGYSAWVTGIRRVEAPTRANAPLISYDEAFGLVKVIGRFVLLYGRRTMVFCVLAGYLFGYLTRYLMIFNASAKLGVDAAVLQSIGYIIPGLIAYWMLRQGIVETVCTMLMASFIVRLGLIVAHGGRLIELAVG